MKFLKRDQHGQTIDYYTNDFFFVLFLLLRQVVQAKQAGIIWSSFSLFDDIAINEFLILNGNKNFKISACPLPSYAISPRKFHPA